MEADSTRRRQSVAELGEWIIVPAGIGDRLGLDSSTDYSGNEHAQILLDSLGSVLGGFGEHDDDLVAAVGPDVGASVTNPLG